jgi:hypothetical protein
MAIGYRHINEMKFFASMSLPAKFISMQVFAGRDTEGGVDCRRAPPGSAIYFMIDNDGNSSGEASSQ